MTESFITLKEVSEALKPIRLPEFSQWIRQAYPRGHLDLIVQGLIQTGRTTNTVDSIRLLADIWQRESKSLFPSEPKVTLGDINQTSTTHLRKKLEEVINGKQPNAAYDETRRHGTIGHVAIPELFLGKTPLVLHGKKKTKITNEVRQADLFNNGFDYASLAQMSIKKRRQKLQNRTLATKLTNHIISDWVYLQHEMKKGVVPLHSKRYTMLRDRLKLIFDVHMSKIVNYSLFNGEYLSFLTFMTWAGALDYYQKEGSMIFFQEVFILENTYDLGAGRLDALMVETIDGVSPTAEQLVKISALTKQSFASVGHIIKALIALFGKHIHLCVIDWKFAVGDSPKGMRKGVQANVIKSTEVEKSPLQKHVDQVKRYLSLAVLSHSLASRESSVENLEELWKTDLFSMSGKIVYFFPDSKPFTHEVGLDKEEIKLVFQEQIVNNYRTATQRSTFRKTSGKFMGYVLNAIKGRVSRESVSAPMSQLPFDPTLPESLGNGLSAAAIINGYYKPVYLDPYETIEVIGRNNRTGADIPGMHLDRVLQAINDKKIIAEEGFNRITGGKICCHVKPEKNPSHSIDIPGNRFRCFGCGVSGWFIPSSIPDDIEISFESYRYQELDNLVIPPRHQEIMLCAQFILQKSFQGSRAEAYLACERGLNPALSYTLSGAGYADHRLITGLLDSGFSYDELIEYGFLTTSTKIGKNSNTVRLLNEFGLKTEDLLRPGKTPSLGLPMSLLDGAVTYPLEVHGIINSFYGRSTDPTCPKKFRHKKLRAKVHKMRHGGCNITLAAKSTSSHIIAVEAALNMDTIIQHSLDLKAATALVGANNPLLWEILAGYKGSLIIGLDYDPENINDEGRQIGLTGQINTEKFARRARQLGFEGTLYDFTAGFVKNNPGIKYNDLNQYWTDYGEKFSILDNLKRIEI